MDWIQPIYDRTTADVTRALYLQEKGFSSMTTDEQNEWLSGLKGALNKSDLERIENDIQFLSDVEDLGLITYCGNVPEQPKTSYFNNLRSNVQSIRNAFAMHTDTPSVPSAPLNSFSDWNDIEEILATAYETFNARVFYYAGTELYSGNNVLI